VSEHPRDVDEREHGPEWWAMGGEVCKCGHTLDQHIENADWYGDGSGTRFPCGYSEGGVGWANRCSCLDFELRP
jgi:hypothetical protein